MAMGSTAGADALIACLDAEYTYLAWRPAFAIPRGDTDRNARTVADPDWTRAHAFRPYRRRGPN
jgi:hypothetical protein